MEYIIDNCKDGDADYIIDRLVEYNLANVLLECYLYRHALG